MSSTHIKSAARKLPIKRKSSPPPPNPNQSPNPNNQSPTPSSDDAYDAAFDAPDDNASSKPPPPFKFHRIWSESDEIRFLQGLLGCSQQGMVFPRDLNLFYDRFSGSMPQPYTRSQLSEKLRRLRKKFRIMSGRIARGQDPARLAPHDKDLLHLCTRLWDPSHAATSPFSAPDGSLAPVGNKRRRPNPRPGAATPAQYQYGDPLTLVEHTPVGEEDNGVSKERVAEGGSGESGKGNSLANAVLNVFNGALCELRESVFGDGDGMNEGGFERRWREQRFAEFEVLASRLRLVIDNSN